MGPPEKFSCQFSSDSGLSSLENMRRCFFAALTLFVHRDLNNSLYSAQQMETRLSLFHSNLKNIYFSMV